YVCFNAAYRPPIPIEWRLSNVLIRQTLARDDYRRLLGEARFPRLLDDLWAQFRAFLAEVHYLQVGIVELKNLEGHVRLEMATDLEVEFRRIFRDLIGFINSHHVVEIFRPGIPKASHYSTHSTCCPSPPFPPYIFHYAPSGYLRMVLYGLL